MRRIVPVLLGLLALVLPAAALASHTQTTSFEAPSDLLDPARRDAALDQIAGLGVQSLRLVLYWHDVSPQPDSSDRPTFDYADPARYDWSRFDPVIDGARARGMQVLLTVSGPAPRWGTLARRNTRTRPSPRLFGLFMQAAARHFGDRVAVWAIWNEPNHPRFLLPQHYRGRPVSGLWYRRLYLAGYHGLVKGGLAHPTVLLGETAPAGSRRDVAPLVFLRQTLCLNRHYRRLRTCARLPASGYAHHPYTKAAGPFYVPPGRDDVSIGVLHRLVIALDRAGRAGGLPRRLPIYLTEFGIQSKPDPYYGVSQARQAEFQAISERIAWSNPRVRWFSQYLLRDDQPVKDAVPSERYGGFESGLRFSDGRAKLALRSFPVPLAALRGHGRVTLWGLARPAHAATTVTIDAGTRQLREYAHVRTDANGYFVRTVPYIPGRRYRLRWEGHTGPPIRVYRRP